MAHIDTYGRCNENSTLRIALIDTSTSAHESKNFLFLGHYYWDNCPAQKIGIGGTDHKRIIAVQKTTVEKHENKHQ